MHLQDDCHKFGAVDIIVKIVEQMVDSKQRGFYRNIHYTSIALTSLETLLCILVAKFCCHFIIHMLPFTLTNPASETCQPDNICRFSV